jgi:murein DD-endopeptidase MepM/ murein hydrolase activator NlpD
MTAAMRILLVALVLATLVGCTGGGSRAGARVISPFGALTSAEGAQRVYGPHIGIDLAAAVGTPVLAAADDLVWSIGDDGPCGTVIVVTHESFGTEGFATRYCRLSVVRAAYQEPVRRGEVIALTGTTGQNLGDRLRALALRAAPGLGSDRSDAVHRRMLRPGSHVRDQPTRPHLPAGVLTAAHAHAARTA